MKVTPRIYQNMATTAAIKGLRGILKRALVVLATGLGKTLTAAFIARKLRTKRILFLVHNNFILRHAMEEFQLVFDENTKMVIYNGISKAGVEQADIVFATWQTMRSALKKWKRNHFDLVIVDEAHHSEAETYRPTIDHFTAPKLGITATPDREDEADIREVFGHEVINVTLEEAIAHGWLPRIEYHVVTDESLDENALQKIAAEIKAGKKRFTMAEVNRRIFIKKRDLEIARIINGYEEKAIVFCSSISHAERMRKSLKLSESFHSRKGISQRDTWNRNKTVLDSLKNGVIRRVTAVNAFNEGVNVPSVGLVAFCRVTGVVTIFRQQLGRGLRPGKEKLVVLDFVGNLERIQLVMEMMNRISDLHEKFTPRGEIEREGYVRQQFEVSGKGFEFTFSDKVVDLMKILEHCEQKGNQTAEECIALLQSFANELGKTPTQLEVNKNKNMPTLNVLNKYFGTFTKALIAAGLGVNQRQQVTDEELIGQLKKLGDELGRTPSQKDVGEASKQGKCSCVPVFVKRFGSFSKAVAKTGAKPSRYVDLTKTELLNQLRVLSKKLNRIPTARDLVEASARKEAAGYNTFRERFGYLNKALRAAGLTKIVVKPKPKPTDADLIRELKKAHKILGRIPTTGDMTRLFRKGKVAISWGAYAWHFGSADKALKAAGLK